MLSGRLAQTESASLSFQALDVLGEQPDVVYYRVGKVSYGLGGRHDFLLRLKCTVHHYWPSRELSIAHGAALSSSYALLFVKRLLHERFLTCNLHSVKGYPIQGSRKCVSPPSLKGCRPYNAVGMLKCSIIDVIHLRAVQQQISHCSHCSPMRCRRG